MDAASKMEKHYGDCFAFGTVIAVTRNCAAQQVDLCGARLNELGIAGCPSETGKYDLTIRAGGTTTQYVLDATPIVPQMVDPACDILSLMSTGVKCANINTVATCSNTGAANAAAVAACWGR